MSALLFGFVVFQGKMEVGKMLTFRMRRELPRLVQKPVVEGPYLGAEYAFVRGQYVVGLRSGKDKIEGNDEFLFMQGFLNQPFAPQRYSEAMFRGNDGQFSSVEAVTGVKRQSRDAGPFAPDFPAQIVGGVRRI